MQRLDRLFAAAATIVFVFSACNASSSSTAPAGSSNPATPANASAPAPTAKTAGGRGPTTDPALKNADGSTFTLADVPGDAKVVNFWATWCAPCIGEMPTLNALAKKYESKNVTFVAVSVDENGKDAVEPALKRGKPAIDFRVAYASLDDKPFGVEAPIPDTLVFDGKNQLVKHFDKVIEADELEAAIAEALSHAGK